MAASSSVPPRPLVPPVPPRPPLTLPNSPLAPPVSPLQPPSTPTALKLKTKFMDRHAQEGASAPLSPPPVRPPLPSLRLNTTPPPKKRLCSRDFDPPKIPSPPLSPVSQGGATRLPPPLTPIAPLSLFRYGEESLSPLFLHTPTSPHTPTSAPQHTHIPQNGLDLSVRGALRDLSYMKATTWHAAPTHHSAPPHHHLNHHHHHHHHHHQPRLNNHQQYYLQRRFQHHQHLSRRHHPFLTGAPSEIMLSESMLNRVQDVSPTSTPTAPKKVFDMDTSQKDTSEYKKKPMAQWTYNDVVHFFLESKWSLQATGKSNFIFSNINGATGQELMHFSRSKFLEFSPKCGDEIFEDMQQRVAREMELDRAGVIHPRPSPTLHSPSTNSYTLSPSSLSLSSPTTTTPSSLHHSLHHPQPSIICDAPARYEFRFEPAPSQPAPHPRFQVGGGLGGAGEAYSAPPSASKKSFSLLPPLLAMDGGREREERRERVTGDAGPGDGRNGEQSRRAEEEVKVEPPKKRGPGRPRKPENELKKRKKKTGRLWEFIRNLLLDPETCPSLVKWENAEEGLFRFVDAEKVARKWGDRKQNNDMNYEKLSRAMRYYYKTHIFEAVIGRRLVYKFGKNAKGWRPSNPNFPDINRNLPTHRDPPPPPQPPPTHHHSDPTPQIHLHTDPTPQIHLHSDLTQAIPHHSDSTPSLHHQADSKSSVHHQLDSTPSLHHERELKLSLHHRLDSTPLLHHHTDDTPSLHHQGDSKPSIHHHMDSKALLHHHSDLSSPLQLESQHHMEYKSESPPPPPLSHHHQHHHTLQSLALHHHQLQHPHNTT